MDNCSSVHFSVILADAVTPVFKDGHLLCLVLASNQRCANTEGLITVTQTTTPRDARPFRQGRKWFERYCHSTLTGKTLPPHSSSCRTTSKCISVHWHTWHSGTGHSWDRPRLKQTPHCVFGKISNDVYNMRHPTE